MDAYHYQEDRPSLRRPLKLPDLPTQAHPSYSLAHPDNPCQLRKEQKRIRKATLPVAFIISHISVPSSIPSSSNGTTVSHRSSRTSVIIISRCIIDCATGTEIIIANITLMITVVCSSTEVGATIISCSPIVRRASWSVSSHSTCSWSVSTAHPRRRRSVTHRRATHVLTISSAIAVAGTKVRSTAAKVTSPAIVIGVPGRDATCSRSIVTNELDRKNCKACRDKELVFSVHRVKVLMYKQYQPLLSLYGPGRASLPPSRPPLPPLIGPPLLSSRRPPPPPRDFPVDCSTLIVAPLKLELWSALIAAAASSSRAM
ncbi:hypothetical protein ALC53_00403 [Atta colombica]|uniref:Uncharacterized protein n=1 Tax=Atta colombica TaxID=520822 RepID=A0A195BX47_9HYME|nr:hypothetical protein ALC53_00403 [Atta colombica]